MRPHLPHRLIITACVSLGAAPSLTADPMSGPDCDGDGTPDTAEIEAGAADCDFDGVPDACEISDAPWLDCDGDGVIDRCAATYRGDDGGAEFGFGSTNGQGLAFLWAKGFVVEPGLETIGALEVCWRGWDDQPVPLPGSLFTIGLLSDPDGDGAPNDATVLVAVDAEVVSTAVGEFQVTEIPATVVGASGDHFFVAVYISVPPTTYPVVADEDPPLDVSSWRRLFPAGQGGIDQVSGLTELSSIKAGDFLLHAVGVDAGAAGPADLTCDGAVDGADLGAMLSAWNTPGADLDGDGVTNGADLGALLAAWTGA